MFNIGDIISNGDISGTVVGITKHYANPEKLQFIIECLEPSQRFSLKYFKTKINEHDISDVAKDYSLVRNLNQTVYSYIHSILSSDEDFAEFKKTGECDIDFSYCQFKYGDKVITKKTGPINIGTVTGICRVGHKYVTDTSRCTAWNTLYPQWSEKPVYFIDLDTPNKSISKEEFARAKIELLFSTVRQLPTQFVNCITEWLNQNPLYEHNPIIQNIINEYNDLSIVHSISVPEEDLSLVDTELLFDEVIDESISSM